MRLAIVFLACGLAMHCACAARDGKYYKILGISEDADEQTIKKAYRKGAMKWHPDRNPDNKKLAEKKFAEIAAAYETLSDPEKKRIYDQLGEEGLKQGGGQPGPGGPGGPGANFQFQGDPFEIFSQFFGGQNPFGGGGGGGMGGLGGMMGGMGGMPGMGGMGGMGGMPGGGKRKRGRPQGRGDGGGGLYDSEPAVVKVDSSNFPGKGDTQVWLLEFYAPWCGHCRNLVPKWTKVAQSLKGIVKVGAVNCDEEKQLCAQHGVQGYPTIKSFSKGQLQEYQGDRSASGLKAHGLSLLSGKAVKTLNKASQVTEFLKLGRARDSKSASWGTNMILFTSKSNTAPLTKSLASQFEGKIAFGECRASNKVLGDLYNITSYPTLIAFCNGDAESIIRYKGEFKSAALTKFMREFQGGKKCQQLIKIDQNTDLNKFRVGQLKEFLHERDADCIECTEKKDYVKKLRDVLQARSASDRTEL